MLHQLTRIIVSFFLLSAVASASYITAYSKSREDLQPALNKLTFNRLPLPGLDAQQGRMTTPILSVTEAQPTDKTNPVNTAPVKSTTLPAPVSAGPSISIPAAGIRNQAVDYASVTGMDDLYQKMLYKPVVENLLTADFCTEGTNTYVMGHSEPPSKAQAGYPAANVFTNLYKLQAGKVIQTVNSHGVSCSYRITKIFRVTTDANGYVPADVYNDLFWPVTNGKSVLTIQTCEHGSATVRVIIRAEQVD